MGSSEAPTHFSATQKDILKSREDKDRVEICAEKKENEEKTPRMKKAPPPLP